jgi:hypothetical protein
VARLGLILVLVTTCSVASAPILELPSGARFTVRMTDSIGTTPALGADRRAELTRRGQRFRALLVTPISDATARVRAPTGALVEGRIVALRRGEGVSPPVLELAVDRVCNRPLRARVVDPPFDQVPRERSPKSLEGATFTWLFFGAICFGVPGFILGSTVGSVSGAVEKSRGLVNEAWLPAGTLLTVELTAPTALAPPCRA